VKVPLTQKQFDALYSLCFNIGETNFKKSTVVKKINENDLQGAADAILMWNKPDVLVNRRKRERALFLGA
jgi:lysozyme